MRFEILVEKSVYRGFDARRLFFSLVRSSRLFCFFKYGAALRAGSFRVGRVPFRGGIALRALLV